MVANLEFTADEFTVMHDAQFFIHKKNISDKIISNFTLLNSKIEAVKKEVMGLPEAFNFKQGKINKGENYELLPYLILDNPGVFKGNDVFAFRVMFWWGNFYSCTLHVSGSYLDLILPDLEKLLSENEGYYFCISKQQWQHHFREDNYQIIKRDSYQQVLKHINENQFLKISFKKPLTNYHAFEKETIVFLSVILSILKSKNQ